MSKVYPLNNLDEIRISTGIDNFLSYFNEMAENNIGRVLKLLSDKNLTFPTFFLIKPSIEKYNLYGKLTLRNKTAFDITKEILTRKKDIQSLGHLFSDYLNIIHSTLRWIIETGYLDDGLNDDYNEIIDIASLILTRTFRDKTVLPYIADIIFARYRKGFFLHQLIWAFFEAKAPESLVLIADRLRSPNEKDVELAQKLLSFCPVIDSGRRDSVSQFYSFMEWIEENSPFLYFKGESLQQTNTPIPYAVALESKYLHNQVLPETGNMLKQLTESEMQLLSQFIKLDLKTQILLSNFSIILHKKDRVSWNRWLLLPVCKQIKEARQEGFYD